MIVRSKNFGELRATLGSTGSGGNTDSSEHYIELENIGGFIWDAEVVKTDTETRSIKIYFQGDYEFNKMLEALIAITNKMLVFQKL